MNERGARPVPCRSHNCSSDGCGVRELARAVCRPSLLRRAGTARTESGRAVPIRRAMSPASLRCPHVIPSEARNLSSDDRVATRSHEERSFDCVPRPQTSGEGKDARDFAQDDNVLGLLDYDGEFCVVHDAVGCAANHYSVRACGRVYFCRRRRRDDGTASTAATVDEQQECKEV
jgi:hypothetical protein